MGLNPVVADGTGVGFAPSLPFPPNGRYPAGAAPSGLEVLASAEQFITLFHGENQLGPADRRLAQTRREIEMSGTYWHTPAELAFGARVAWRNSSRCIGRLYWRSLRVRDRRDVTTAPDIVAESVTHLHEATNGGRIRGRSVDVTSDFYDGVAANQ